MTLKLKPELWDFEGAALELGDIIKLKHMLGIDGHDRSRWGWRNRYAPADCDVEAMLRLEAAGLVRKGNVYFEHHYYHATELAADLLSLGPAVRKRVWGKSK